MESDWAWNEMKGAAVPDVRLRGSLADVCERLAEQPGLSFSAAAGPAGRQAFRRLGSVTVLAAAADGVVGPTDRVPALPIGPPHLLAGHLQATATRCGAYRRVLVAQDTTELQFPHSPLTEGLGPTGTGPK